MTLSPEVKLRQGRSQARMRTDACQKLALSPTITALALTRFDSLP